jgi:integrase
LFDPTLEKYLGVKINSNIVQLPGAKPELKLGELWLEFAEYKLKTGQIHETTYLTRYKRTFLNWLKPYLDESLSRELAETIIFEVSKNANKDNLKKMIGALSEACERAIHNGHLSKNYFWRLQDTIKSPKKSQQLTEEEDYRA